MGKETVLQHRYTELLEKRIAQSEAIVEKPSKNVSQGTADKDTKSKLMTRAEQSREL